MKGGVLVVVGEDYGEGASVIQERTHAFALKSGMLLLDPRPDLGRMVDLVEHGFGLSEASNMPALMELRIRACHVRGSFTARDNRAPAISTRALMDEPAGFDYARLAHPPVTFRHEKLKYEERFPAARRYIVEHGLKARSTAYCTRTPYIIMIDDNSITINQRAARARTKQRRTHALTVLLHQVGRFNLARVARSN